MIDWLDANLISLLNGLQIGILLFTLASGLSLIFGLMDVFNLAHGAIFLVGAYIGYQFAADGELVPASIFAAVAIGALLGSGLFLALKPIERRGHLDQALLTFGIAFILQDTVSWIWGNDYLRVSSPDILSGTSEVLGQPYPTYRVALIVTGLVIALLLYLLIERTQVGAVIRAAVVDRDMVSALGVNVSVVFVSIFALGSALAAFGGVVGGPILGVRPGLDIEVLVLALIVVVIGGLGSLKGAFIGSILIGETQALGVALYPQVAAFVLFGVMAAVLLVRPAGLFGSVKT
jgi:branched-chain amino acid transport system permease protein